MLTTIVFIATVAGPGDFHPGPVIREFGPIADVPTAAVPADVQYKIVFDVTEAAKPGEMNRSFVAAARLINMHAAAGVPVQNTRVAIVVHSKAHTDLKKNAASAKLVAALIKAGARLELCGQTAAYYDVTPKMLVPGVKVALSAMTAHAVLQRQGYTLNPF